MPWKDTKPMEQRHLFIADYVRSKNNVSALARNYGISRKTAYKWIRRFENEGFQALQDQAKTPKNSPQKTPGPIEKLILAARRKHPTWGPRKLKVWLSRKHPNTRFPASSTIGDILKRNGLVKPRSNNRRRRPQSTSLALDYSRPNSVWCVDFKGEFRLGNTQYCYPLTISDGHSRFLLSCYAIDTMAYQPTRDHFEQVFSRYGLPNSILSDNGTPFRSNAVGGLSRLAVWWIKLGITPIAIHPGKPQENGRHERFHRVLKAETTRPPGSDLCDQQEKFFEFQTIYNEERPHQALNYEVPAKLYRPSRRAYNNAYREPKYPGHYERRRVRSSGEIKFGGRRWFLSETLVGSTVGLVEVSEGTWDIYFERWKLAAIEEQNSKLIKFGTSYVEKRDTKNSRKD